MSLPLTLPSMLAALQRVFPDGPSWPFRTQSAQRVWEQLERVMEQHPNLPLYAAQARAFQETGIPSLELTPEDYATLNMAARWKAQTLQLEGRRKQRQRVKPPKDVLQPRRRSYR